MGNGISAVTGGKGHVGFALVKELADRGEKIRLLVRGETDVFEGIDCEKVIGDVRNIESLENAFRDVETVYHIAGVVDISGTKDKLVWDVNYTGTQNVVAACKKMGVRNLVFVSSIDALAVGNGSELITEANHFDPDTVEGTYAKSKAASTQYVLDSADENLKVTVVHPSTCIGPYDNNGTSSMCTVIKFFAKGLFPITFDFGSCNFVDVRDLAKAMIASAEKTDNNGECYFICGDVITLDDFMGVLANACGKKHPKLTLKIKFIDKIISPCVKLMDALKLPPMINEYSIRKLQENFNFSNEKARRELGYEPRPLEVSLRETAEWLLANDK